MRITGADIRPRGPAPALGGDTVDVLAEIGYTADEAAAARRGRGRRPLTLQNSVGGAISAGTGSGSTSGTHGRTCSWKSRASTSGVDVVGRVHEDRRRAPLAEPAWRRRGSTAATRRPSAGDRHGR